MLVAAKNMAAIVGGAARAGLFARGRIAIGPSAALTVPPDAIVIRDGFAPVPELGEGDRVQLLRGQTGRLADGRVEITQGLDANARVVVRGGSMALVLVAAYWFWERVS